MTRRYDGVTDHAIVRYIERVAGISLDFVRDEILKDCQTGMQLGASAVKVHNVKYVLTPMGAIKTVLPKN